MDFMVIFSALFVCFYVEALSSHHSLTLAANDSNASTTVKPINTDTGDFPFPEKVNENEKGDKKEEKEEEEDEIENEEIQSENSNYHSNIVPSMDEVPSEKLLLNLLSTLQRRERENVYENWYSTNQPVREDYRNWDNYYDLDYKESTAFDDFSQKNLDYNEFYDYKNDYFLDIKRPHKEQKQEYNVKYPALDYYEDNEHKNDYYDYYHNKLTRSYKSDDRTPKSTNKQFMNNKHSKGAPKSSCKQYLQFLKYAFKKLDETPKNNYDYFDFYDEDRFRNQDRHTTNVMGPTVFIDTCGTNGHSNFEKFTFDGELPSTIPYVLPEVYFYGTPRFETSTPSYFYKDTRRPTSEEMTHFTFSKPWFEDAIKPTMEYEPESTTINYGKHLPYTTPDDYYYSSYPLTYPDVKNFTQSAKSEAEFRNKNSQSSKSPNSLSTITDLSTQEEHTTFRMTTGEDPTRGSDDYDLKTNTKTTTKSPHTNIITSNTLVPFKSTWYPSTSKSGQKMGTFSPDSSIPGRDCNDKMLPCPDIINVTYPLNGYCDKYVTCEMGRAIRRTCPEGLQFNVVTKSCDLPHNSFCNYMCPHENGYYGVPGDCGGYFKCKNSIPEYRMCPPGMHWDVNKKSCVFVENSLCPMTCSAPHEAKQYEGVCNAYVICINGIPYYHKCPPNMNFDQKVLTCVPQNMSNCQNNPGLLTMNPDLNDLCRNVQVKFGSKSWCRYMNEEGGK